MNKMEEYNKEICIREINENIKRVFNDEPLTRPLRVLRNNCEFKKRYDLAFDLKYNVRKCLNCRKEFKDINEEGCCSTNCKKEYRKNHPKKKILTEQEKKDKIAEKGKEYRENNKDKIAERRKKRYVEKKFALVSDEENNEH